MPTIARQRLFFFSNFELSVRWSFCPLLIWHFFVFLVFSLVFLRCQLLPVTDAMLESSLIDFCLSSIRPDLRPALLLVIRSTIRVLIRRLRHLHRFCWLRSIFCGILLVGYALIVRVHSERLFWVQWFDG